MYALWFVSMAGNTCHLVTLLLQLDYLPDDPETVRDTEGSKSTCQNLKKRLLSHELHHMAFNGTRYELD